MPTNPFCPCCDVELEYDDHYDVDDCGDSIIYKTYGHCPTCRKEFRWKDIYIWTDCEDLEEID